MLPRLIDTGILPPGVHRCELPELVGRFGRGSAQRIEVTQRLQRVLSLARGTGFLRRAFVWGSYVTASPHPNDVDIMLVMGPDFLAESCNQETQDVFDCELAEEELGATVLWVREDVPGALLEAFLDQWQVGRDGTIRGIVEVRV